MPAEVLKMNDYLRFNAIVVDPDITTRMRLKHATTAVPQFDEVHLKNSLDEALWPLDGNERCDVIFISYLFDLKEVTNFIERAKQTKQGRDSAYVLVLKTKDQDHSTVANSVMLGVDGFLFEPYSVDSLVEITNLATKIRREREAAREKLATTLLLTDVINQLDLVASLKSLGYAVGNSLKKLHELCQNLHNMPAETLQPRLETIVKLFTEIQVPRKVFQAKQYTGVSSRVRKRMEEKILTEIQKKTNSGASKIVNK